MLRYILITLLITLTLEVDPWWEQTLVKLRMSPVNPWPINIWRACLQSGGCAGGSPAGCMVWCLSHRSSVTINSRRTSNGMPCGQVWTLLTLLKLCLMYWVDWFLGEDLIWLLVHYWYIWTIKYDRNTIICFPFWLTSLLEFCVLVWIVLFFPVNCVLLNLYPGIIWYISLD